MDNLPTPTCCFFQSFLSPPPWLSSTLHILMQLQSCFEPKLNSFMFYTTHIVPLSFLEVIMLKTWLNLKMNWEKDLGDEGGVDPLVGISGLLMFLKYFIWHNDTFHFYFLFFPIPSNISSN